MRTMLVAVGTTRRPKLNAVWEALNVVGPSLDADARFEIVSVDVPSGVRHTPLSQQDTIAGARNRAEALIQIARDRGEPWAYFVGLEGGLNVVPQPGARDVFLENWACVMNANGRNGYGQSGALLLPPALAKRLVDDGIELGEAIDDFARRAGVRDAQGAWGVLTRNMITRQDAFRTALINAFAPFYNRAMYDGA